MCPRTSRRRVRYFNNQDMLTIDGYETPPGQPSPTVIYDVVSPDYFQTLRIPMAHALMALRFRIRDSA